MSLSGVGTMILELDSIRGVGIHRSTSSTELLSKAGSPRATIMLPSAVTNEAGSFAISSGWSIMVVRALAAVRFVNL